jgi:hypothetical protein
MTDIAAKKFKKCEKIEEELSYWSDAVQIPEDIGNNCHVPRLKSTTLIVPRTISKTY